MRDNLRQYRAIREAFRQGYPGESQGRCARHMATLAALLRGIRDNLGDGLHDFLQGRLRHREALVLLQPSLPSVDLLQDQAQRLLPGLWLSPVKVQDHLPALIHHGEFHRVPVANVTVCLQQRGEGQQSHEALLLASCGPYLRPIVSAALHTDFRKSELLSLLWGNVDFRHSLITVEAAYAKNGEARSVPMTVVLTDTLKASRINAAPAAAVFLTREGQPYRDISTAFATAVRRAGITDFTFHDLRHTFASRLVMVGVDLTTVKELMGHKHIAMTLRYTHLAPGHKRSAIAVLDRLAEKVPSIFTTGNRVTALPPLQVLEK